MAKESRINMCAFKNVKTTMNILHVTTELVNTLAEIQPYRIDVH